MAPLSLIAAAGLATLAAPTMAQESKPSPRQSQQAERPTLSGPRVREQRVPGTESGFSADAESGARKTGQPVPVQVFRKAIGELMAEDAPLAIRLSPEQRERISSHVRAFEQKFRSERDRDAGQQRGAQDRPTDRREPQTDRRQNRDRPQMDRHESDRPVMDRRPTDRRQTDRPQSDRRSPKQEGASPGARSRDERPTVRNEMARALAGLQTRIWAELSAAQQAHVSKAIEASRAQAADERMGRVQERYRREIDARFNEMDEGRPQRSRRSSQADAENSDDRATGLRQWFSRLPEDVQRRVHEQLESMPAERREAIVARALEASPEQRAQLVRRLLQSQEENSPRRRPQ